MNRSRLQIAKSDIVAFLSKEAPRVMKLRQLGEILSNQRRSWRLAQRTTTDDFITFLTKGSNLRSYSFEFPTRTEMLFVWGEVPLFEILQHIKARSHFSHYTAMRMHGLTEQVPKVIYISHERTTPTIQSELSQTVIDEAFQRPARISNNVADFGDQRIVLLNSAFTGELGVIDRTIQHGSGTSASVRISSLERTLIDAAVRPAYSGGVFEVAQAFVLAKDSVSVNSMSAMLQKLGFAYPYHQAIGFYLERAGYRASTLDLLRRFPMKFDFYLTHAMAETSFNKTWRVHVPKGL
jgi:hypothetical protein